MSHAARNASIAAVVVVAIIVAGGFLYMVPVTTAKSVPYVVTSTGYSTTVTTSTEYATNAIPVLVVQTQTVTYATSSTTQVAVTQPQQVSSTVYSLSAYTLNCNTYVYLSASLQQGWNLVVSYSAGDTITVYLFTSQEYSSFQGGGNPTPEKTQSGLASGQFGYSVPLTDTYYLVLDNNLHNGLFCVGGEKVTINSATGTATYTVQTTTYINQVVTYTTSSQTLVTQTSTGYTTSTLFVPVTSTNTYYFPVTSTSTSTASCSYRFWYWLTGSNAC